MESTVKSLLKRNSLLRTINAKLKCSAAKKKYARTLDQYRNKKKPDSVVHPVLNFRHRLPRIFFLGTDEQQDRSGTLQALGKFGQLSWFTRVDGAYGQNHPGSRDVRRSTNTARLRALFEEMAANNVSPDVLIAQTWAGFIDPVVFDEIRARYGTLIINIAMDDRHQYWGDKIGGTWDGTYGLIPHLDLTLTAAPECVDWYLKEGCPALFFPEASDPEIFHPMPDLGKIHDVSFVGARYGIRERIVLALRKAGIKVTAYGSGWEGGRLPIEAVPQLFAQSRIILGVGTIGHCHDFYALKMRDFDAPMSGSFYLTHDNPDLHSMYQVGEEIETYHDIEDCVEKARQYLADERLREQVAAAGHARALREHTWEQRFHMLFDYLQPADTSMKGMV